MGTGPWGRTDWCGSGGLFGGDEMFHGYRAEMWKAGSSLVARGTVGKGVPKTAQLCPHRLPSLVEGLS